MTTGAIYGNFKNRDQPFISLGQTYWTPIKARVQPGATFPEIMRALADATLAAIPNRSAAAVDPLTGVAYTLTQEELRAKVAAFTAQSYAFGDEWLHYVTKEEDLPKPADQLVRIIPALTEGVVFQRLLTPELMPDEVFHAACAALGEKTQKD
jgi:hypothetical protein